MSSEEMFKTPPEKSEFVTRKQIVDRRLRDAGWKIVRFDQAKALAAYERCAIEEYPTENGPADYALCVGGKILGIVEAKKLTLGPQNVLMQAERYSKGLLASPFNFRGFRVPFLYSSNGEVIWHHDVRHELNRSREVQGFHTPDALLESFARDFEGALAKLAILPNDHPRIVARPYQVEANAEIEKAIGARKRQMLIAMATGTGKTFMTVSEVYRLMKSGVAKRILFLVDRRALAAQAVRTFASFEPETGHKFNQLYHVYSQRFHRDDFGEDEKFDPTVLPSSYLLAPKSGDAFVYVCTIQRMAINLFGREVVTAEPVEKESRTVAEVIQDIWDNQDRDYNVRCLVKRLHRIEKEMSGEAREKFAAFVAEGDLGGFARDLPAELKRDFTGTMKLLRNPSFQELLVTYPRRKRTFVVAYETKDVVASSWLVRGADGKEYKPEDYLAVFARFVEENPDHIEAIRILQKAPEDWSTEALVELTEKLKAAPQRFTVDNLQRAHEIHYQKALADIISMVKHAANRANPLLTAGERVERAFENVAAGRTFTAEQQQWLERIKAHLVQTLSIDEVFSLSGFHLPSCPWGHLRV